jgi:hypothetical protein
LGRLIEAFSGLQTQTPLVLVGARAWLNERELSLLPENDPRIIRLDYLDRNALLRLTRVARAVLFPRSSKVSACPFWKPWNWAHRS